MGAAQIRFDDGAAYEDFMGRWSELAGDTFLRWLNPPAGWRWVDVGCGNGAFTELLVQRSSPLLVQGIDPSEEQIAYARQRLAAGSAQFEVGDAMALPYADGAFDAAVMALVIFFVPDPAKSVGEMARVDRPGGSVSAYAWDIIGGGFAFANGERPFRAAKSDSSVPGVRDGSVPQRGGAPVQSILLRATEYRQRIPCAIADFRRLNHRMHNKLLAARAPARSLSA